MSKVIACKICGQIFEQKFHKSLKVCSEQCHKIYLEKKYEKYCSLCGKSFSSIIKSQKFCSVICRRASLVRNHFYTCLNCGEEYLAKTVDRNKFCSRACAFSYRATAAKKNILIDSCKKYKRLCLSCQQPFETNVLLHEYCSASCRQSAFLIKKYPPTLHTCPECGNDFEGHKSAIYCQRSCAKRAIKRENRHRKRAGSQAGESVITIDKLGSRDGWKCGICEKGINKDSPRIYPLGASIDHIIPLSKGGNHSWSNVQIAHIGCNTKKSNKITVCQLRLEINISYAKS